jgi:hypothetical protein
LWISGERECSIGQPITQARFVDAFMALDVGGKPQ